MADVVGRGVELAALEGVLRAAREGLRVVVVEGEAGIGKTTLWREGLARGAAAGFRVLACRAAQAESRLSFAALGDVLASVEESAFVVLPGPQRRALEVALLRADAVGAVADARAIGTALVSLLSGLAARAPVLVALDDVQWLDRPSARALEFALRRLESRPVAVLATLRSDQRAGEVGLLAAVSAERVSRLELGPLSVAALYEVLKGQVRGPLTRPLLTSIERASRGNPFFALQLVHAVDAGALEGGELFPVSADVDELVTRRIRRLPQDTREELLRASALAAPALGLLDRERLEPAVEAGVVRVSPDGGVEFAHPLFASAVYTKASSERRRRLHHDLAERVVDVEEQARHLALASDGPDERVAAVLDRGADRASRRGAPEVAGELAQLAAQRTPAQTSAAYWERCLRAAGHYLKAGDRDRAAALAQELIAGCDGARLRGGALHLLAEIRAVERPQAAIELLEQAIGCVGDDVALAARLQTSLGLIAIAVVDAAGAEGHLRRAVELGERAAEAAVLAEAMALRALASLVFGRGVDEQALARALALEDPDREVPFQLRPSLNVAQVYEGIGRIGEARELLAGLREQVSGRGEESDLAFVLVHCAATAYLAGELELAECDADEALRVAALNGQDIFYAFALSVRAMARAVRADAAGSRSDAAEALAVSEQIGWPHGISQSRWAQAVLALSEDDAPTAANALAPVAAAIEQLGVYEWTIAMSLPDAIEALTATGEHDVAARHTDALAAWGRAMDRPWALALSARCRAILLAATGDPQGARSAAEQALVEHQRLPMPFELARTLLALGQAQRRTGQRRRARESLQRALELFDSLGAPRWAAKARGELARIGVRRAPAELTENEQRVAQLAAQGLTNREIAARLFISARTVEANLARAYRKLGIHSRAELGVTIAERSRDTAS